MNPRTVRRSNPLRRSLVAGGAAVALVAVGACSTTDPGTGSPSGEGGTLERIKADRVINVGFANERPYAFRENGQLVGQSPAVHGYIFDQIGGISLEPNLFEFGSLIQSLNSQRVDVVTAGMFITPERCEQAAFSNPVYVATTSLL
ncbi:MAG: transporter substrate-binding domain-containing protein, partial [Dietzia sp.]|nr:transporter substrate-binding domain-containing protein [Dietzia sp.]